MFQSVVCPQCGQIDAVRKVSAVVSEGTSSTEQLGIAPNLIGSDLYLIGMQGSSVTNLAQRLTPAQRRPGGIGLRLFLAGAAMFIGSIMACGLSVFSVTHEFGRFACGNWVLGIGVVTAALTLLSLVGIPQITRKQAEYDWMMDRVRGRWGQLYYCARDDVAFNPQEGVLIPISGLSAYLYEQTIA